MRQWILASISLAACAHVARPQPQSRPRPAFENLAADTPRATLSGSTFTAPGGWSIAVDGPAVILETPEPDSHLVLVDVQAPTAEAAVASAWAAYRPEVHRPVRLVEQRPARDGWDECKSVSYETSPNERVHVNATAYRHGDGWTVYIFDGSEGTYDRRVGQALVVIDSLRPRGYQRETFAGRTPNRLDAGRVRAMQEFVETASRDLGIPGVSFSLVQDGRVVYEGGVGVRELGKAEPVDADSLYIIASNTKALSTLMLGKLVDAGRFGWDSKVTSLYPDFRLGDAETTKQVLVKHLVCACTGLPRQDYEWLFEFKSATAASEVALLGTMQPTSRFGEVFQYSNLLASVAGFLGAHVLYPSKELGAAYDESMRTLVFEPLGMKRVTFEVDRALRENHASPHGEDVDGHPAIAAMDLNRSIYPLRPAGGLWASVRDLTRYVQMELANGKLPDGSRYVSEEVLRARLAPNVAIGQYETYGMGLTTDSEWGVPVVHHGGSMVGYKSDMIWLPGNGVGAVILTNSDVGGMLTYPFMRRLVEVLFDGKPEAAEDVRSDAVNHRARVAKARERLTVPADAAAAARLAPRYFNRALGEIAVRRDGPATVFDFGEWRSAVASRKNDDGSLSFATVDPGTDRFRFVVADKDGKRALVLRDAQHEYVFDEAP